MENVGQWITSNMYAIFLHHQFLLYTGLGLILSLPNEQVVSQKTVKIKWCVWENSGKCGKMDIRVTCRSIHFFSYITNPLPYTGLGLILF